MSAPKMIQLSAKLFLMKEIGNKEGKTWASLLRTWRMSKEMKET